MSNDYAWEGMPLCSHGIQFDCERCARDKEPKFTGFETTKILAGDNRNKEPEYTAISFMFRNSPGKNVDTVMELLDDWLPCDHGDDNQEDTCYLESMGGCSGTDEQCWKSLGFHESIAQVNTDDLKKALLALQELDDFRGADWYERLRKEAYWYDEYDEWVASLPDDEEEEIPACPACSEPGCSCYEGGI